MLIFDVYTDGEVRQNNGTYSYPYERIHLDRLFQISFKNYWWLRSPDRSDYYAWLVWPFGDVHNSYDNGANGVDSSYGHTFIRSPVATSDGWAWLVSSGGDVIVNGYFVVASSYGHLFDRLLQISSKTTGGFALRALILGK